MAWILKEHAAWLAGHGRRDTTGWICKTTGADINAVEAGRSIHEHGLMAGSGEVCKVLHLYCTGCNPDYQPPVHGTPIQERDLVEDR